MSPVKRRVTPAPPLRECTVVMGVDGSGKSAWCAAAARRGDLAGDLYDAALPAAGLQRVHAARTAFLSRVQHAAVAGAHFTIECSLSDHWHLQLLQGLATDHGVRLNGLFLGTDSPEINLQRIAGRDGGGRLSRTALEAASRAAMSGLGKVAGIFHFLELADCSADATGDDDPPSLITRCELHRGSLRSLARAPRHDDLVQDLVDRQRRHPRERQGCTVGQRPSGASI